MFDTEPPRSSAIKPFQHIFSLIFGKNLGDPGMRKRYARNLGTLKYWRDHAADLRFAVHCRMRLINTFWSSQKTETLSNFRSSLQRCVVIPPPQIASSGQ